MLDFTMERRDGWKSTWRERSAQCERREKAWREREKKFDLDGIVHMKERGVAWDGELFKTISVTEMIV